MKTFFKCTLSALAVSAVVVLAFLSSGCNKEPEKPSDNELIGVWHIDFYENEWGGDCSIDYDFLNDKEVVVTLTSGDEQYSEHRLWRLEGNKLFSLDKEVIELYEDVGMEWPYVDIKLSEDTMEFLYDDNKVAGTFVRKK